jgi:hypothetical protein
MHNPGQSSVSAIALETICLYSGMEERYETKLDEGDGRLFAEQ